MWTNLFYYNDEGVYVGFMTIIDLNKEIQEKVLQSEYSEKRVVFGEGSHRAEIFMIGEAPGGDEEAQGRPFVGKAGKNLNHFLETVGLKREEIYITNVVKIRPISISPKTGKPVNRTPNSNEVDFFVTFLRKEIELMGPQIIVTLGNIPLKAVADDKKVNIGDLHGCLKQLNGYNVIPLYHPAAIIYNRSLKETYDSDLEKIKNYLSLKNYRSCMW